MATPRPNCPVCVGQHCQPVLSVQERGVQRDYWRCTDCHCRFLQPDQRPSPQAEAAEYRLHQNDANDPGYRRHLATLCTPLLQRLRPAQQGLDFGCGPGPVLADMLREAGHTVALYDPFFQPDTTVLDRRYAFITCTEVVEHFHHPAGEFQRLAGLLLPGGWLGVMTRFQTDDARFAQWHYRRDPTHVVFYREASFHWLAQHLGLRCEIPGHNLVLLHQPT